MKRMFLRRKLVAALIATATCSAVAWSGRGQTPAAPPPKPADPIIKLQSIDGRTYNIADLRGNVVLVSFGATWCSPCTAELHALLELTVEYKDKPVKFFWVTIENEDEASNKVVARYARARLLTFPVLRDPSRFAFNQFSPRVRLPMIVFFDKEGHVDAAPHFGMSSQPENYKSAMRQRLNKLLGTTRSEVE